MEFSVSTALSMGLSAMWNMIEPSKGDIEYAGDEKSAGSGFFSRILCFVSVDSVTQ